MRIAKGSLFGLLTLFATGLPGNRMFPLPYTGVRDSQGNFIMSQNRLNRGLFVGYHSRVTCGWQTVFGLPSNCLVWTGRAGMDVSGLGSVGGAGSVRSAPPSGIATSDASSAAPASPKDELELSEVGRALDQVGDTSEVRAERLNQIKESIDNGTYDTDEKLDVALSRMFDAFGIELDDI